jgi:sulfoxide reductase heme-binding subunit YedZ
MSTTTAARRLGSRKRALWRDPQGQFSPLKLATLVLLCVPGLVLAVQWEGGMLGARPITEVLHGAGLWTIRLLFITLAISPLAAMLEWPRLLILRRMVGVACALYGGAHLTLFLRDQNWHLLEAVSEIALRFYLTIGFVALCGLSALAITSTDGWMRRLRRNWSRLHKLIYPIALVALVHFALQSKSNVSEAVLMSGFAAWLLGWRLVSRRWRPRIITAFGLAIIAGPVAALLEAGWYWVRNGADPLMVLSANLDVEFGLRPALWAAVVLAGVALLVTGRRLARPPRRLAPAR